MKKLQLNSVTIFLVSAIYKLPKFGKWIKLEILRSNIVDAVGTGLFPEKVIDYVSTALNLPKILFENLFWVDIINLFYVVVSKNNLKQSLPLLEVNTKSKKSDESLSWDYNGRSYFIWVNLLAERYGWSIEYINNLQVSTALSLIQEILTEQQLEKEFQWSMTEVAYQYDSATKTSKFVPLERPYWMLPKPKEIKKVKIRKELLPMGNIVDLSGMADYFETTKNKKT